MTAIEVQAPNTRPCGWRMRMSRKVATILSPPAKGRLLESDVKIVLEKSALSAKSCRLSDVRSATKRTWLLGRRIRNRASEAGFAPTTPVIGLRRHRTAAS